MFTMYDTSESVLCNRTNSSSIITTEASCEGCEDACCLCCSYAHNPCEPENWNRGRGKKERRRQKNIEELVMVTVSGQVTRGAVDAWQIRSNR